MNKSNQMLSLAILFLLCLSFTASISVWNVAGDDVTDSVITEDTEWTEDDSVEYTSVSNETVLTIRGCNITSDGIYMMSGSTLIVENVDLDMRGTIYTQKANVHMSNVTITGSTYLLWFADNSTVTLENVTITGGSSGIIMDQSHAVMSEITVSDCSTGIIANRVNHLHVSDSTFHDNAEGLDIRGGEVIIINSTIKRTVPGCGPAGCGPGGTGVGIGIQSGELTVIDSNISENFIGLQTLDSIVEMDNCRIYDNLYFGTIFENTTVTSQDSTFNNNDVAILSMFQSIPWASDPSDWNSNTFLNNNISYLQEWHLALKVVDTDGDPIRAATAIIDSVSEFDNMSVIRSTDAFGNIDIVLPGLLLFDNGEREDYNHTVEISKTATNEDSKHIYKWNDTFILEDDQEILIELPLMYPDLEVVTIEVRGVRNKADIDVVVVVKNVGDAAAFDFRIVLYVNNESMGIQTASLLSGEETEVIFSWESPEPGTYSFRAEIDPARRIDEKNLENNVLEKNISVEDYQGFPIHILIGGIAITVAVFLLYVSLKKNKPDVEIKM